MAHSFVTFQHGMAWRRYPLNESSVSSEATSRAARLNWHSMGNYSLPDCDCDAPAVAADEEYRGLAFVMCLME